MTEAGFQRTKSRYFKHPQCSHLLIEFPPGPVELGEQYPVIPDEVEFAGYKLKLLSPTDSIKDRLAGYIHWGTRDLFDQALLVYRNQKCRIHLQEIEKWCHGEGGSAQFTEFQTAVKTLAIAE